MTDNTAMQKVKKLEKEQANLTSLLQFYFEMSHMLEFKKYNEVYMGVSRSRIDPEVAHSLEAWYWNLKVARRLYRRAFNKAQDEKVARMTDEYYSTDLQCEG